MNCPDVRQLIHLGLPQDAESYIQESGRAGRDNATSTAFILKAPHDVNRRYTSEQMIEYCRNKTLCRRSILLCDFECCDKPSQGCLCCDIYAKTYCDSHAGN